MHPDHAALLAEIRRRGEAQRPGETGQNDSYGGSGRPYYLVSVPDRRAMARAWVAAHRKAPAAEALALVESLFDGVSHEEKTLATLVLRYSDAARRAVAAGDVERWLGKLNGWAEVDSLCQNLFTADDFVADWPAWKRLIEALSLSPDINKRRAALVLLVGPVHYSADTRFNDLALVVLERLKPERPILITKAVSWLLRSMVTRHREAVIAYLDANTGSLPKVAIRETKIKLKTGTKSGRKARP